MINKPMVVVIGVRGKAKTAKGLVEALVILARTHSLTLVAFDPDSIFSMRHLEHAYELASRAFEARENIARSLSTEILLKAAGTNKIDRAIERVGVKDATRFILLSDKKIPQEVLGELGDTDSSLLKTTEEKKKKIAKLFGIPERSSLYSTEELLLERLVLSD